MSPEILYEDEEVSITSEDVDIAAASLREEIPLLADIVNAEVVNDDLLG